MAERRMFAKTIIDSDAFLDMPISARLLYYDLGMRADDDGFVNSPKKIMKFVGATNDDINILIMRKFIIPFDNGVVVIKHWRIHNYIRKDTYSETPYKEQKSQLELDENNSYRLITEGRGRPVDDPSTQVSIGKDSIGNIGIINNSSSETKSLSDLVAEWNKLSDVGIKTITKLSSGSKRYQSANARIKQYGYDEVVRAINNIRESDFLKGDNKKGWVITFDWFVLPNNFPKVLEGNYANKEEKKTGKDYNEIVMSELLEEMDDG